MIGCDYMISWLECGSQLTQTAWLHGFGVIVESVGDDGSCLYAVCPKASNRH